jgi:hypothetical protein
LPHLVGQLVFSGKFFGQHPANKSRQILGKFFRFLSFQQTPQVAEHFNGFFVSGIFVLL